MTLARERAQEHDALVCFMSVYVVTYVTYVTSEVPPLDRMLHLFGFLRILSVYIDVKLMGFCLAHSIITRYECRDGTWRKLEANCARESLEQQVVSRGLDPSNRFRFGGGD